jgi:hypothetical protein
MLDRYGPHTGAVAALLDVARSFGREDLVKLVAASDTMRLHPDTKDLCAAHPTWSRELSIADHDAFAVIWDKVRLDSRHELLAQLRTYERARDIVRMAALGLAARHLLDATQVDERLAPWRAAMGETGLDLTLAAASDAKPISADEGASRRQNRRPKPADIDAPPAAEAAEPAPVVDKSPVRTQTPKQSIASTRKPRPSRAKTSASKT